MISFNYETTVEIEDYALTKQWIINTIIDEGFVVGEINYIFCNDDYLHKLNVRFLNHNTYTDIISFDYSIEKVMSGDIYISVDRVKENAKDYQLSFNEELHRVIIHGILHFCGWKFCLSIRM